MVMVVATMNSIDFYAESGKPSIYTPFVSKTENVGEKALMSMGNAMVVLLFIILGTTLFYLLYKYKFLKLSQVLFITCYLVAFAFFTPLYVYEFLHAYSIPCSIPTTFFILFNFGALGLICIHWKGPQNLKQFYHITSCAQGALGLIKYFPDWSTWFVLAAIALWDVANVLWKKAPLRRLIETAEERDDDIFGALVYSTGAQNSEGEPSNAPSTSYGSSDPWGTIPSFDDSYNQHLLKYNRDGPERRLIAVYNPYMDRIDRLEAAELPKYLEMRASSQNQRTRFPVESEEHVEEVEMNLGLGDFLFYSILVGKASSYFDWNTTVACFMAILVGLCLTLVLHAMTKKPLPALTISIFTGLLFYFGTHFSITPFISEINHYQIVY